MRPLFRTLLSLLSLLIFCQIVSGPSLHAAQLSGWIEPSPASVNLTAEGSRDWIQGGYNGDYTKLDRKAGANLLSGLTVAQPLYNGALVRDVGPTLSWSDGTPDATCSGTTSGVHAQGSDNSIRFTVPAGTSPKTIRIYSSSVHAAMQFKAHLSDGSAPDWVNEDWYASSSGTITPKATLSFASASADAILTVTISLLNGPDWPSVGIHAVTLQDGATAVPPMPLPPVPTGLSATAGNGQVMVQWNQGPFASSYNVYRSTNGSIPSSPWQTGILPIKGNNDSVNIMLSTLDTSASNGTTYSHWIAAVNAGGETRAPQSVTATPAAPTSTAITTGRMLKILPMGDSITYGYPVVGGYRKQLVQDLSNGGYQFHMVGRAGYNSTGMAEPLHEGWPGKTVEYLRDSVVDSSLPAYQPDLILLMIGTNNLAWGGKTQTDVDNALSAYDGLLNKINTLAPNATVIVSPILPIQGTDLPTAYNQALHNRVNTLAGQGRQVYWCSQMSNITLAQLGDGVHPGAAAYTQMGDAWYAAIQSVSSGSTGVASPNFTPAAGSYSSTQSVTIASNTAGATIYYTTDGSNPTTSSATYTGAISVASTTTIKAMAAASGKTNSPVVSATYTIAVAPSIVATPSFTPAPGTFSSAQSVTIASNTGGATIRYTTDGSTPNSSSALYTGAISVSSTTTIRAIAVASGMSDSQVAGGTYTITIVPPPLVTVATPSFTPAPGTFSSAQSVTIACSTAGATIRYTTDGSAPTASSAVYAGAISVSSTTTIQAIATAPSMTTSNVASATYTITIMPPPSATVATPSFTPAPGTYSPALSVTLACSTADATIHYTTDGSTPTASSAVYTGGIFVSNTTTIQALATATGMANSQVASGTYIIAAAPVGTGTGLTGTYFPNVDFTGTSVTRLDGTVDFDWGQGSPATGIPADNFCVRWSGQVEAVFSETYTFTTLSDDGVRLWVNGQLLVDNWTDHPPTENGGTITLVAGQKYDVKMEIFEHGGGAVAKLSWASPSTSKQIIPMSHLFPSGVTPGDLPAGWTAQDVGGVAVGGATTQSNGIWTVSGSGSDIWDNADGCRFASQRMTGDVQVTAQVSGLSNTDIWAKAGVMIRESLATGSRHASTFATASNGIAYQRRLETDGYSSHTAGPFNPAPYWVRIERVGNVVISSSSPNGSTWTEIRRETIAMSAAIYVGLAVTSHNNGALCTATFTNVQVVGVAAAAN